MALRSRLILPGLVGVLVLHPALGMERAGDAAFVHALRDRTQLAQSFERDLRALIAIAAGEECFDLYRTYDRLAGAWFQVALAQSLLADAASARSASEEGKIRTTLRDQARFAVWDLADAVEPSSGKRRARTGRSTSRFARRSARCSTTRGASSLGSRPSSACTCVALKATEAR